MPESLRPAPASHRWSDLSSADFAGLDRQRAIAVLPLAATEQHGPHLPLSVDADLARAMTRAAAERLPADFPAFFLPVQDIGSSPEHLGFAGTLSLRAETVLRLWTEIAECVHASGIGKLVLFNTHGGNVGLMDPVARDLRARLGMLVYRVNWFDLPLLDDAGNDIIDLFAPGEQRFGVHAGQVETALMLAIRPEQVRQEAARDFSSTSQSRARDFAILGNGRSAKLAWAAQDLNPAGAVGNAAAATAADGQLLLRAAGRALAALLQEIDRLPPDTLRAAGSAGSDVRSR